MTREEMIKEYFQLNYERVQNKIKEAMLNGKKAETFRQEGYSKFSEWIICQSTIDKLKDDGFIVYKTYDESGNFDGDINVEW